MFALGKRVFFLFDSHSKDDVSNKYSIFANILFFVVIGKVCKISVLLKLLYV